MSQGLIEAMEELRIKLAEILMAAVEEGATNFVDNFLNNHKIDLSVQVGKNRFTALHIACQKGNTEMVELLLKRKASVEIEDVNGNRALHHAVLGKHAFVVLRLIQARASPNHRNKFDMSPHLIAAFTGHHVILGMLKTTGLCESKPKFGRAAKIAWERLALKGECSDKAYNRENGLNFLQVAVIAGDVKATEYLLNQSDGKKLAHELVSCSKRSALTALQLAYTLGHFEILKLLLRYANEYGIMMATERSMPDLSLDVGSSYLRQDSHSMHPHKQMKADRPEFMKFE